MSLSLNNKAKLVNLHVQDLVRSVARAEHYTGVSLDIDILLYEIMQCIVDKETAQLELELYWLDIVEKYSIVHDSRDCRTIIKLFISTGKSLVEQLSYHGLYKGHRLGFVLSHRVLDNLIFLEMTSDNIKALNDQINVPKQSRPRFLNIADKPTELISGFQYV